MLTGLFDTHAHYDSRQFDPDRDQVLSALPGQGVALVVNPGCDLKSSRKAIELAERYPFVYAAVGVHPEDCGDWKDGDVDELRAMAAHPKVVAVGEIGLDYYWKDNPRDLQKRVFRAQLALAVELDLPAIVHDREAHGDCLDIVRDFPEARGVFHCFSGSAEMAMELVRLGWMISFTGVLTYKNARKAVEAAQAVPLERIMLETDSPYMAPVPYRGKRNCSGYVGETCARLAELKGMGYGIYLLSNAGLNHPQYFDRVPGSECFDGRVVSAFYKLLKPQPELYQILLREFSLKAEECFFVDDLNINVEAAELAGMSGCVFRGVEDLRQRLIQTGIPVRPPA